MRTCLVLAIAAHIALAACGDDAPKSPDAGSGDVDAPIDAPSACPRMPGAADRTRYIAISHPYDVDGNRADRWNIVSLSATGELALLDKPFTMGRASIGEVAFTPDGKIGVAPLETGDLGVFSLGADGTPTVIATSFHGSFYAERVVMAPSGDHVFIVDVNTRENGGGIYRVDLACDGTPIDRGLVIAGRSPGGLAFLPGDDARAIVAARELGASAAGVDTHLVDWSTGTPSVVNSIDAFADDMQIIGGTAPTFDGAYFLAGDNSGFGTNANRVAIVEVGATALSNPVTLSNIEDPIEIIASPFGNVAVVVSGFGNAFFVVEKKAGAAWTTRGQMTYVGAHPELPAAGVMLEVGAKRGLVLVAENLGIRRFEFHQDGSVVDLGKFATGVDLVDIVGAIGVTP